MKKKITLYVIAAAILAIAVIGGTLAFFTDETEKKTNEFTFGDVAIELEETAEKVVNTDSVYEPGTPKEEGDGFDYDDVLPGVKYSKKPVITVCATSSDAYVFAEITIPSYTAVKGALTEAGLSEDEFTDLLLENDLGEGKVDEWIADDVKHVVYTAGVKSAGYEWTIFKAIQIPDTLTKPIIEKYNITSFDVAVKGYGVQAAGLDTPADAWAEVDPEP